MAGAFNLSRVFRYLLQPSGTLPQPSGAPQISDFPDDPPDAPTDLEVRIKHFTEIENFTFLGYVLAHETAGAPALISTLAGLQVPDREFQAMVNKAAAVMVTPEELGDTLLDVGINWEHFVASNNDKMIPGNPLKVNDTVLQEKIDSLDLISEALVNEVNLRSKAAHRPK